MFSCECGSSGVPLLHNPACDRSALEVRPALDAPEASAKSRPHHSLLERHHFDRIAQTRIRGTSEHWKNVGSRHSRPLALLRTQCSTIDDVSNLSLFQLLGLSRGKADRCGGAVLVSTRFFAILRKDRLYAVVNGVYGRDRILDVPFYNDIRCSQAPRYEFSVPVAVKKHRQKLLGTLLPSLNRNLTRLRCHSLLQ